MAQLFGYLEARRRWEGGDLALCSNLSRRLRPIRQFAKGGWSYSGDHLRQQEHMMGSTKSDQPTQNRHREY